MECEGSIKVMRSLFQEKEGGALPTPSLKFEDMIFRKITKSTFANKIFVKNHYAHRAVPITLSYGAFSKINFGCVGAISFGKPASYTLCNGICGEERSNDVYELNRLWMDDVCPKNSESRFIGWSLRMIKRLHPNWIIVSFADTAQGHSGTIYRATNFIYTGITKPHLLYDHGDGKHGRHAECSGEKTYQRSIKHRYVWFSNKEDEKLLRYKKVDNP